MISRMVGMFRRDPQLSVVVGVGIVIAYLSLSPTLMLFYGSFRSKPRRWLNAERYKPVKVGILGAKPAAPELHDSRIRAFSLSFDAPLDWTGVQSALEMLTAFRAQNLLRMKAIVNLQGEPGPVVLACGAACGLPAGAPGGQAGCRPQQPIRLYRQ